MLISISSGMARQSLFGNLCLLYGDLVFLGGSTDTVARGELVRFSVFKRKAFDDANFKRPLASLVMVNPDGSGEPGILLLDVTYKGVGIGTRIVQALQAGYGTLHIHEIKSTAAAFWAKLGAVDKSGQPISESYSGDAVLPA